MLGKKLVKIIKYRILYNTYCKIVRKINSVYPELFSGLLDNMLVIAPHPDDDVIGCGGILAKNRGKRIKVIFITDGRRGDSNINEDEIIAIRKKEAIDSLNHLGVNDISFLNIEDGKVRENISVISEKLKSMIKDWDNIFVPFILDSHDDHKATTIALHKAIRESNSKLGSIWFYEVWSMLIPNMLVDITDVIEEKSLAINMHRSQVNNIDYPNKILGLNQYRSISISNNSSKNIKYCEAYYKCNINEFNYVIEKCL